MLENFTSSQPRRTSARARGMTVLHMLARSFAASLHSGITARFSCTWRAPSCQSIHMLRDQTGLPRTCYSIATASLPCVGTKSTGDQSVVGAGRSWALYATAGFHSATATPRAKLTISRLGPAMLREYGSQSIDHHARPNRVINRQPVHSASSNTDITSCMR